MRISLELTLCLVVMVGCYFVLSRNNDIALADTNPQTPEEEWLSWGQEARLTYVRGYLQGFERGKRDACYFYEEKMDAISKDPQQKLPRSVCLDGTPEFTHAGHYQLYVDTITKYCAKYPRDRQGAPTLLMDLMANPPNVLDVDQLHAKLH